MNAKERKIQQLNSCAAILAGFKETWQFKKFMRMPQKIIGLFSGNQAFKTSSVCFHYVIRVLGYHPVPKKNVVYFECSTRNNDNMAPHGYHEFIDNGVRVPGWEKGTWNIKTVPKDGKCPFCGELIVIHQRQSKKIRLCSETLPGDKETVSADGTQTAEIKNTVYPELKKWMPPFLMKRDITFRNPAYIVHDPLKGLEMNGTVNNGDDIVFDFMSYSQSTQAGAGVQRMSCYCDEESPKDFHDEQIPRLLAEDGDLIIGLTPAHFMSWTFDEIFENAQVYYRTQLWCDYANKTEKDKTFKLVETTDNPQSIGVVQASTYDNPTLSSSVVKEMFDNIDDPDVYATRCYGIHRQISGRIFKGFDFRVHVIAFDDYFPDGIFHDWNHYRMIDYHPHNRWAIPWLSMSPQNEAFVWQEWDPDPEKTITRLIANEIVLISGSYKFKCNLIDPLAAETQTNTGATTVEDLNDAFLDLKREGVGTGGFWETYDTKGARGREVIRERLKYAKECKRPFNNKVKHQGTTRHLPTLWISNRCMKTARSLKQWSLIPPSKQAVDKHKDKVPAQKWSHFCTALEAIFKDKRLRPPLVGYSRPARHAPNYFQGSRRSYG